MTTTYVRSRSWLACEETRRLCSQLANEAADHVINDDLREHKELLKRTNWVTTQSTRMGDTSPSTCGWRHSVHG